MAVVLQELVDRKDALEAGEFDEFGGGLISGQLPQFPTKLRLLFQLLQDPGPLKGDHSLIQHRFLQLKGHCQFLHTRPAQSFTPLPL